MATEADEVTCRKKPKSNMILKYRAAIVALSLFGAGGLWQLWRRFGKAFTIMVKENQYLQVIFSGTVGAIITRGSMMARQKIMEKLWATVVVKSSETELWNALLKVHECVRAWMRACVDACVRECVRA